MGAKLRDTDRGWRGITENVKAQGGSGYVRIGIFGDDERGGLHVPGADLTVGEIAVVQEYGTVDGRIPARSFVRSTYDEMQPQLLADGEKLSLKVLDGRMPAETALGILGAKLAAGMKNKITQGSGVPPPNAPSTMARKIAKGKWNKAGSAQAAGWGPRPLVDTGRMVNAIGFGVFTSRAGRKPIQYVDPNPVSE